MRGWGGGFRVCDDGREGGGGRGRGGGLASLARAEQLSELKQSTGLRRTFIRENSTVRSFKNDPVHPSV